MFGIQRRHRVLLVVFVCHVHGEVIINGNWKFSYHFVVPNPESVRTCENINFKRAEDLQETVKNLTEQVSRLNTTSGPVYNGGFPTSSSPALNAKTKCECSCNAKVNFHLEYRDCQDVRTLSPLTPSGIYNVFPVTSFEHLLITNSSAVSGKYWSVKTADPFPVYCELSSFHQYGWTVVQRRVNFDVNFNHSWSEYKHGFGDKTGDFWLGLEKLHILTNQKFLVYLLRITIWDYRRIPKSADMRDFKVGSEATDYNVNFSTFTTKITTYIGYFKGARFSTFDHDKDQTKSKNCGVNGGWWYRPHSGYPCGYSYLNAAKPFLRGDNTFRKMEMKIRPVNA